MRIALTVVALFVTVLSPAQKQPSKSNNQQNKTHQSYEPPPVAPVPCTCICQPAAPVQAQGADKQPEKWYWPPVPSNWALVVVGAGGVCIGLRTLRYIAIQTKAASAAANAALLNAQAVIKSERPWIIGREGDNGFKLFGNPSLTPKFSLAIKNSGRTPGKLVRVLMKFEKRFTLDGLKGIEDDLDITCICPIPYVLIIPGDPPFTVSATITGEKPMTQEEMVEVRDGRLFLVAYGVIEYEDVFDTPDKSHKSGFFFYYACGLHSHGFQTYYSAPSDYLQVT